jgi:hypothetical protein
VQLLGSCHAIVQCDAQRTCIRYFLSRPKTEEICNLARSESSFEQKKTPAAKGSGRFVCDLLGRKRIALY